MPKISITAMNADVQIQDDFPSEGLLAVNIDKDESKDVELSWGQLQRIEDQLSSLESLGYITYTVSVSSVLDARTQVGEVAGQPLLDYTSVAIVSAGSGTTDVVANGVNLLAGAAFAEVTLGDVAVPNDTMRIRALIPGTDANEYSIEIIDVDAANLAVSVVGNVITVNFGGDSGATIDVDAVIAAINAEATAKLMVLAERGTDGDGSGITVVTAETLLTGGLGSGIALTMGGDDCIITAIDETTGATTFNSPVLTAGADDGLVLAYWTNGKLATAPFTATT